MISRTERRFWTRYHDLPGSVRAKARKAYRLFHTNPDLASLDFKPLRGYPMLWSVRITLHYRAVGLRDGDTITWFWIGSHSAFDKEF